METVAGREAGSSDAHDFDVRCVGRRSREYPECLTDLAQPPECLWVLGRALSGSSRMVAIVGTRRATEYGRRMSADLAAGLATAGWTVVSGMARGIDAAAHRGALDAGGSTVAVLGCGVDVAYPASNRDLSRRIVRHGTLLSELSPGTPPLRHHFPKRNRIIAALARAVVVVQAGERSGALITADAALNLSREVLAVPGPADQAASRGVHRLLQDGAGLVTSAADVLAELGDTGWAGRTDLSPTPHTGRGRDAAPNRGQGEASDPGPHGAATAERVLRFLRSGPASLEDICGALGLAVPVALSALGRLDVSGHVRTLPGHRYERARGQ